MIAPIIADIIETIINVKAHPNSPAVSVASSRKTIVEDEEKSAERKRIKTEKK